MTASHTETDSAGTIQHKKLMENLYNGATRTRRIKGISRCALRLKSLENGTSHVERRGVINLDFLQHKSGYSLFHMPTRHIVLYRKKRIFSFLHSAQEHGRLCSDAATQRRSVLRMLDHIHDKVAGESQCVPSVGVLLRSRYLKRNREKVYIKQ